MNHTPNNDKTTPQPSSQIPSHNFPNVTTPMFGSYSQNSMNGFNGLWMNNHSSLLSYQHRQPVQPRDCADPCLGPCGDKRQFKPLPTQVSHPTTAEYDSAAAMYPYLQQPTSPTASSYPQYNGYHYPHNPSNYMVPSYAYRGYIKDCNPFVPQADHIKMCPSMGQTQTLGNRDPLLEHNYARPFAPLESGCASGPDVSAPIYSDSHALESGGVPSIEQAKSQFPGPSQATDEFSLENSKARTRKPKQPPICKELLMKPMECGFSRVVQKQTQSATGEPSKKTVVYTDSNGTVLSKKSDVERYLAANPSVELRLEHFSFDSRLSLNSGSLKKQKASFDRAALSSSHDLTVAKTKQILPAKRKRNSALVGDVHSKDVDDDPLFLPETKSRKSTISSPKGVDTSLDNFQRAVVAKHRKLISKYFRKLVDDSKFLDGFAPTSYRKKLPNLLRMSYSFSPSVSSQEGFSMYGDLMCVDEFLKTFSEVLVLKTPTTFSLNDLVASINDVFKLDSLYFKCLSSLLKCAVSSEKFGSCISVLYFIDNIFSINWDWLVVAEIFRLYVLHKGQPIIDLGAFPDSLYYKMLLQVMQTVTEKLVYSFKPALKSFVLRFLIDQIISSNKFANIVNDTVDNMVQIRRDRFHIDIRIRQLKSKNGVSTQQPHSEQSVAVNTESDAPVAQQPEQEDETKDSSCCLNGETTFQLAEIMDLETERSKMKNCAEAATFLLRSFYLGSDRHGREYFLPQHQGGIIVEGKCAGAAVYDLSRDISSLVNGKTASGVDLKLSHLAGVSPNTMSAVFGLAPDQNALGLKMFEGIGSLKLCPSDSPGAADILSNLSDFGYALQHMLIDNSKFIKSISDDEVRLFVDLYKKTYLRHSKKSLVHNEFDESWWRISDKKAITEFSKCLNQRGTREHNLFKSFNRFNDYIMSVCCPEKAETSDTSPQAPAKQTAAEGTGTSQFNGNDMEAVQRKLIYHELTILSQRMDGYLSRIGNLSDGGMSKIMKDLMQRDDKFNDYKSLVSTLISHFVTCCERKIDRPWLSKWNDSLEYLEAAPSIYLMCQSLRIKIDPNSKICQLCDASSTSQIMECSGCLLCAHETCLQEPMRRHKKTKMICHLCTLKNSSKSNRTCKICLTKVGKTVTCSNCQETLHTKCLPERPKSKSDPVLCPDCRSGIVAGSNGEERSETITKRYSTNMFFKLYSGMCRKVLKAIEECKDSSPFVNPVDPTEAPSYYETIKRPMDLRTIKVNLNTKRYNSLANFYSDIMQIFDNCRVFNEDNSKVGRSGARLRKVFEKVWKRETSVL